MIEIEADKIVAAETQKVVAVEEAIATEESNKANEIKVECEYAVGEANKILESAVAEVSKLKKEHIVEVKSMKTPPPASIDILGGMCYLLQDELKSRGQIGMKMKKDENNPMGKKIEDYLSTAAILLDNPEKLKSLLLNYDKENIN